MEPRAPVAATSRHRRAKREVNEVERRRRDQGSDRHRGDCPPEGAHWRLLANQVPATTNTATKKQARPT